MSGEGLVTETNSDMPKPERVYMICKVRKASKSAILEQRKYANSLRDRGIKVHFPPDDTNQDDPVGINICYQNLAAIRVADKVHVFYDPSSIGSVLDFGMAVANGKPVYVVNREEVMRLDGTNGYQRLLLDYEQAMNGGWLKNRVAAAGPGVVSTPLGLEKWDTLRTHHMVSLSERLNAMAGGGEYQEASLGMNSDPIRYYNEVIKEILTLRQEQMEKRGYEAMPHDRIRPGQAIDLEECLKLRDAIRNADRVQLYWEPGDITCLLAFGMIFATGRQLELVNPQHLMWTDDKSFENVLLTYAGLR